MEHAAAREMGWLGRPSADGELRLVERIASGDRDALAELYARYQRPLFSYLLHLTPDRGLAEEILQDTLLAVWKSAGSYEGRSSVRTWLLGVARRQAYNALRRRALPTADASELEQVHATEPEPEDHALAGAEREALAASMSQLAPIHREALALFFGQGLSHEESAAVLGVPVGTVKSRLSNAKRALRALLQGA